MKNILINIINGFESKVKRLKTVKKLKYKNFVTEYRTFFNDVLYCFINNYMIKPEKITYYLDKSLEINNKYIHLRKLGNFCEVIKYIYYIDKDNKSYIKYMNDFYRKRIYKNNKIYREILFYKKLHQIKSYSYKQYRSGCEYKNNLLYVKQIGINYNYFLFKDNLKYFKNFKLFIFGLIIDYI